jgi:hypothetical protein
LSWTVCNSAFTCSETSTPSPYAGGARAGLGCVCLQLGALMFGVSATRARGARLVAGGPAAGKCSAFALCRAQVASLYTTPPRLPRRSLRQPGQQWGISRKECAWSLELGAWSFNCGRPIAPSRPLTGPQQGHPQILDPSSLSSKLQAHSQPKCKRGSAALPPAAMSTWQCHSAPVRHRRTCANRCWCASCGRFTWG